MTSLDNDIVEVDVQIDAEVLDIHAEVQDISLVLLSNTGPPGPKGDTGDPGPPGSGLDLLPEHIASELPHPIYDDGPSLFLLYENAKV